MFGKRKQPRESSPTGTRPQDAEVRGPERSGEFRSATPKAGEIRRSEGPVQPAASGADRAVASKAGGLDAAQTAGFTRTGQTPPTAPAAGRPGQAPSIAQTGGPSPVKTPSVTTSSGETAAGESDKRLIVGRTISLRGEIRRCDRLVVEGEVEASLNESQALEIAPTGVFKGSAIIRDAEIAGHFDGELTVKERLFVRATGRVSGKIHYGRLEIENGGRIGGTLVEINGEDADDSGQKS